MQSTTEDKEVFSAHVILTGDGLEPFVDVGERATRNVHIRYHHTNRHGLRHGFE